MNKQLNAKDLIERYNYIEAMLDDFNKEKEGLDRDIDSANKELKKTSKSFTSVKKAAAPSGLVLGGSMIAIGLLGAAGQVLAALILAIPAFASLVILLTTLGYRFKINDLYHMITNLKISKDKNDRKINEYQIERKKLFEDIKAYNSNNAQSNKKPENVKPIVNQTQEKQSDEMEL